MYIKINNSTVTYDGDLTKLTWQTWNIDLSTVGATLSKVTSLTIGVDGDDATGTLYIDDIRLYQTAPIAPVEPDNANLVAYYAFDGDLTDASGNGYDGYLGGEPTYVTDMSGQALEFDGNDDYVGITANNQLNPGTGSFTMTFWAQLDTKKGGTGSTDWDMGIGRRNSSGSIGYYVGANRSAGNDSDQAGYKFMLGNTSGSRVDTGYLSVPTGEWAFIAAVLDREQNVHKISVNSGSSWATATPPTGSISDNGDISIGTDIGQSNYWFHGLIDEVRFYDTALTNEEIAWLATN